MRIKVRNQNLSRLSVVFLIGGMLIGCTTTKSGRYTQQQDSAPENGMSGKSVKQITPQYEPLSRYGNPESYEQNGRKYTLLASAEGYKERGVASWYGTKFHGRRTSSGETYDMLKMTAAHKTLPIPVYAIVTNLDNGKQVTVKINDRGPFAKGRIIDLSYAAAHQIGMTEKGTANVEVETLTFSPASDTQVTNKPSQSGADKTERYVQVGAFSVHQTAQQLAKVLDREIRLPVKITSVKRDGKNLYRVRIGPIPTEQVAQSLVKTLDIKELGTPKIVYE